MKADIFDAIAVYVPEDHRPEYWRVVARFRHLKPDDEILNIFLAMGILTFLLRDLPAALIEEKKSWKAQLDLFRVEMNKMVDESKCQVVTVNNQTEVVAKAIEKGSVLFNDSALRLEAENLWKPEAEKTQATGVQKVPPAQTIAEFDRAICV